MTVVRPETYLGMPDAASTRPHPATDSLRSRHPAVITAHDLPK
ncbi:MAG TPA: hypothetical protein DEF41_14035 [Desulfovibrio sp.]|uniref:Uncharacterized protein n=1 Tax=Nitratidesulfovibrio vulgaris (strain ATCC 29579 / DSM 644 / CCUG 34227 / NCIMB 8303 / VKM B-1760 / Hildenborough) TaxID=882 RepID=Q72CN0_NITV2|nr:hypothetical protein DVU_1253 [Nitratidesulfovibrio vulgaris str. Hildenborough]HBW17205.1 hypothetical protein [Desulfovibrio sp.]